MICLPLVDPAWQFFQVAVPVFAPDSNMWKFQCSYILKYHKYCMIDFVLFPTVFTEYYPFMIYICCCTHIPSSHCIVFNNMLSSVEFFFPIFFWNGTCQCSRVFVFSTPIPLFFHPDNYLCSSNWPSALAPPPRSDIYVIQPIMVLSLPLWPYYGQQNLKRSLSRMEQWGGSFWKGFLAFLQKHKEEVLFSYLWTLVWDHDS